MLSKIFNIVRSGAAVAAAVEEGEHRMPTQPSSLINFLTTTRDAAADPIWALPLEAAAWKPHGRRPHGLLPWPGQRPTLASLVKSPPARLNPPHLADPGTL
jgi:hypothetical protein